MLKNQKGMGMVEMAMIIAIVIALAFIFKEQLMGLLTLIYEQYTLDGLFEFKIN